MAEVGRVTARFAADTRGMQRGVDDLKRSFGGLRTAAGALKTAFAGIGLVLVARQIGRFVTQTINQIDALSKVSFRLGITTQALSEYQLVTDRAGITTQTFQLGLQRMTRRVSEAAQGMGAAKDAIKELGLEATSLNRLAPDEQFEALADAISKVGPQADKVRLAMKLFDTEGVSLIQVMGEGAEGIRKIREEARKLGLTITDDMVASAVEAKDTMATLDAVMTALRRTAVLPLVRALNALARGFGLIANQSTALELVQKMEDDIQALDARILKLITNENFLIGRIRAGGTAYKEQGQKVTELIEKLQKEREIRGKTLEALREEIKRRGEVTPEIEKQTGAQEKLTKANVDALEIMQRVAEAHEDEAEARDRIFRDEIAQQLELNEAMQDRFENARDFRKKEVEDTERLLEEEKKAAEKRLKELGEVSINVGKEISRAVGDAFQGVILGTSKLADVGKNLFNALLRSATQFFTDVIVQKLAFENLVFTNLRGFLPAASAAVASGAPGVASAATGAVGGGGGILGGIGNIFSGIGNIFGFGGTSVAAAVPSLAGTPLGAGTIPAAGFSNFTLGSIGALGGAFVGNLIGGGGTGSSIGSSVGAVGGAVLGNILLPGIGGIIGGLLGGSGGGFLGGLFGGKSKRKRTSPKRRLAASNLAISNLASAGLELSQAEIGVVQQFGQNAAGLEQFGVTSQGNVRSGLENVPLNIVAAIAENLRVKGGRALGGLPSFAQELERRGLPASGITAADVERVEAQQIAAQEEAERVERALALEDVFNDQVEALEFQITLLGKNTEETAKLVREAELAALAAEGFTDSQIATLRILGEQTDELTAQLALKQEQALIDAVFKVSVQTLEREIALIGVGVEEAAALRREFQLADLAVQGLNDSQLASLKALSEQRDNLIFQLEKEALLEAERLQRLQRFEGLAESIATQIEDTAFQIDTFGKSLEDTLSARRTLELSRLSTEGLSPMELDLLGGLMRERDKLAVELSELQNPGPVNIEITINGNINDQEDVRDLARRLGIIISSQVAPFSN